MALRGYRGSKPHAFVVIQGGKATHLGGPPLAGMEGYQGLEIQPINVRLVRDFDDAGPIRHRYRPPNFPARYGRSITMAESLGEIRHADLIDRLGNRLDHLLRHTPYYAYCVAKVNALCVTQSAKFRDMAKETLKDRLAEARRAAGHKTGTDAARAFGWTVSTYLGYENGDREPGKKMAQRICDAFRVDLNWLLTGRGSMRGDAEAWFRNYISGMDEASIKRMREVVEIAFPKPVQRPKAG